MFENEFVSEAEISKYELDSKLKKHNVWNWKSGRPSVFKHTWTIDREASTFLVILKNVTRMSERTGMEELTTGQIVGLQIQDDFYEFEINLHPCSSTVTTDSPFLIKWTLGSEPQSLRESTKRQAVIQLLKSALTTYGFLGSYLQVRGTKVEFDF